MKAQLQDYLAHLGNLLAMPPEQCQPYYYQLNALASNITQPQMLSFAMYKLAEQTLGQKAAHPPHTIALIEQCIKDLIGVVVRSQFRIGTQALRFIFDTNTNYYKQNNLDSTNRQPLGATRQLNYYQPQEGEQIDVVKPYITSTGYCSWVRGVFLSKDNKKYTVKFEDNQTPSSSHSQPFFDKKGSRTVDYQWRKSLQPGSHIDAYNRVWWASTVVETGIENGSHRVRVTFRRFSQDGEKTDAQGNRYYGLGTNQDEWIDVTSCRIQKSQSMAKQVCYYSHTAQELLIDDTYDLLFAKEYKQQPFWGVMRGNFTRSLSFLTFFEHLCSQGGYEVFLQSLQRNDLPLDNCINMMIVFGNTCFLVPRMAINRHLPALLQAGIDYLKVNYKNFNIMSLDAFSYFSDTLSKRLYSLTQKHQLMNSLRKFLSLEYLKLNLEKQMVALRYLIQLIRPFRPYSSDLQKQQLHAFLIQNQIFYKIIQADIHEQILSRSVELLCYMMSAQIMGWPEIEHIWNVVPHSDFRGRATIQKLLGDISKDFPLEYTTQLLDKLLSIKETDLTIEKLNLLKTLKDKELPTEIKVKMLNHLWQLITLKSGYIKQNIQEEIEQVFRSFIRTIKDPKLKLQVVKNIIERLRKINSVRHQLYLFKEFLMTYPTKIQTTKMEQEGTAENSQMKDQKQQEQPLVLKQVVNYLKQQKIYDILFKLLTQVKASQKEKVQSILEFYQFLFDSDSSDISHTLHQIYNCLGPSNTFLIWCKHFTWRAVGFFVEMCSNTVDLKRFENITAQQFESIKNILIDVNHFKGHLKIVKIRKVVYGPVNQPKYEGPLNYNDKAIQSDPQNKDKPEQLTKQQETTVMYVLKAPFELIGIDFLFELLIHIKSNSVYNDIIKLIIEFIVNLDESIAHRTLEYRQQFLHSLINKTSQIIQKDQYSQNVKLQLEIQVNLIQQLFGQTEKEGNWLIQPHFATIEGEVIKLKIQNNITGNQLYKKQPLLLELNENMTFWKLKETVAKAFAEQPNRIQIIKYTYPIDDKLNGKSISDLNFFNQQTIKVQKRSPKPIVKHDLLNSQKDGLSQKFNQIVERWFGQYQTEGIITVFGWQQLSIDHWKGSVMKEQAKLVEIMSKFDKNNKGGLTIQQFKQFWVQKTLESSPLVWRTINLSGYLNNLKHTNDPQAVVAISSDTLPRKILSTPQFYKTIFQILANDKFQPVHLSFYRLLTMLQTNTQLFQEIKQNLKEFLENQKCIYRLSYGLETIINELEHDLGLYTQFYQHNGHIQVANKLANFFIDAQKSIYSFNSSIKTIVIPNLLKIINLYVYPLCSHHPYVRFAKKNRINQLDVNQVAKKIKEPESYAQEDSTKRQKLLSTNMQLPYQNLFQLSHQILHNLCTHFNNQYLMKTTYETIKFFSYLALSAPSFQPESIFNVANSGSLNLRRCGQTIIYLYFLAHPENSNQLLTKIIQGAPSEIKYIVNTYFDLMKNVLQKSLQNQQTANNDAFFLSLAHRLLQSILNCKNQTRGAITSNKLLQGLLGNLAIILEKKPDIARQLSSYKEPLITKCLFFYNSPQRIADLAVTPQLLSQSGQPELFADYVKCKSQQTRKLLMEVLLNLYRHNRQNSADFFEKFILPIVNQLPENPKKPGSKYMSVGLNNLGSTCYMNSMLQVLNSIQPFRNALMMANVQSPLVHELKSLFSYLFFSQRVDYMPAQLLKAFVPQINPGIQQDTTEFLNFLFDQVEEALKKSPFKSLLEELFKGNQVAQMICHSCGRKRQRIQPFFTYSVQIQGKYDLHSAFEGSHVGELISDCLCEHCGNKSDTTKRSLLNMVPNVFFIHLRRIVFNYDIFMNTKMHTRLYFPNELNYEPYTKQGIQLREELGVEYMKGLKDNQQEQKRFQEKTLHGKDKDYYKLKLKGIIVHSGTADVGHYYTILKNGDGWMKFDDSRISGFATNSFDQQCYGGTSVADQWGGNASSKNAYVLVYQKVVKNAIAVQEQLEDNTLSTKRVPYQQFKTFNTVQWYKQVWRDNHSLMLQEHMTSEHYSKRFLEFVSNMLEIIESPATIELISEIFFKISVLSGQIGKLAQIFNKNLHLINSDILRKYVLADPKKTFSLLFHNHPQVREFASHYIERVLITCLETSPDAKQEIFRFIRDCWLMLHGDAAKNWLRIDGYFSMFQKLVKSSVRFHDLYMFFLQCDLITYLIDFVLEKSSPLSIIPKKYSLGTKSNPVNFRAAVSIIQFLLQRSYGFLGANTIQPSPPVQQLFHLSDNAVTCLSSMAFYQKMIKENQNPEALSSIIQHLAVNNISFSDSLARVLLKCFNQNTDFSEELNTVMLCISKFLKIQDYYWLNRAEAILGTASPFIFEKNLLIQITDQKYTYPSNLQNIFPLQSMLSYIHINRLRAPIIVMNMLKTVLEATSSSLQLMDYLISQPSPSYQYQLEIDWMRFYITNIPNHLSFNDKKKQEDLVTKLSLCSVYLDDLQKRRKSFKVLVLGETAKKQLVESFKDETHKVTVNIYNVPVFVVESIPSHIGNSSFDKHLTNGRLQAHVTNTSNILRFFKHSTKPLAIKAAKELEEDQKQFLTDIFDTQPFDSSKAKAQQPSLVKPKPEKVEQAPKDKKKQLESIQEIIQSQINVQNARWDNEYLRCIEVVGLSDANKLVNISIHKQKESNNTLPSRLKVKVGSNTQDFWYHKIIPTQNWGKTLYDVSIEDYKENGNQFFRLYGNAEPQVVNQQAMQAQADKMVDQKEEKNNKTADDEFGQMDGMMNCPICTFLNPITNTHCECCGSPLH